MGTSKYNLPLVSGTASAKVPRDLNALALEVDNVIFEEASRLNGSVKMGELYYSALTDIENKLPKLRNAKARARKKAKTLKIAFVGDSITEGADNISLATYANRLIMNLKRLGDNLTIQSQNFALGGRNTGHIRSSTYVAAASEPSNINDGFCRPWSTVGKSWKQHVIDYQPDVLIVAFGMNDVVNGSNSGRVFIDNLESFLFEIKTNCKADVILVSTMTPTDNKTLYGQNTEWTQQVADATRGFASSSLALADGLIDTNRLWNILKNGKDVAGYGYRRYTSMAALGTLPFKNFEMILNLNTINSFDGRVRILFHNQNNNFLELVIYKNTSNLNVIEVYSDSNLTASFTNAVVGQNVIRYEDGNISVNGAASKFIRNKIQFGTMSVFAGGETIASIIIDVFEEIESNAIFDELDLLGTPWGSSSTGGGNGINHPTPLGHDVTYLMAARPFLKAFERLVYESKGQTAKMYQFLGTDAAPSPNSAPFVATNNQDKQIYYYPITHYAGKQFSESQAALYDPVKGVFYTRNFLEYATMAQLQEGQFMYRSNPDASSPTDLLFFVPSANWTTADKLLFSLAVDYDD